MAKKIIFSTLFFLVSFIVLFVYAVIFSYLKYLHAAPSFWWIYLVFIFIWEMNVYIFPFVRKEYKGKENAFVKCFLVLTLLLSILMAIPLVDLLARFLMSFEYPSLLIEMSRQFVSISVFGAPLLILLITGLVLKHKAQIAL